jgi:serine phosphatase RsbU (regulator of sigma subunit)
LRFDACYEPADAALLVGGDWYDAFMLRDGKLGVSIGDVSGHGIDAAAQMSSIRNAIRMALVMESDLVKVLGDADFLFRNEAPDGTLCTALIAIVEPWTGKMRFASAGHPGPMIWKPDKVWTPSFQTSPPLGYVEFGAHAVTATTIDLEPTSTTLFYTDGLVEWERHYSSGVQAVREALGDAEIRDSAHPAKAIVERCIRGAPPDHVAVHTMRYR